MSTTSSKPPVAKIRVGNVTANVWSRDTEKRTFFSVTIERSYKDANDQWKSSDSLDQLDLQNARKALDLAHDRIRELDAQTRRQGAELEAGVGA